MKEAMGFKMMKHQYRVSSNYLKNALKQVVLSENKLGLVFVPEAEETVKIFEERAIKNILFDERITYQVPSDNFPKNNVEIVTLGSESKTVDKTIINPLQPEVYINQYEVDMSFEREMLAKAFIPYQFMRLNRSKVVRHLEMYTLEEAQEIYDQTFYSDEGKMLPYFVKWADEEVVCKFEVLYVCTPQHKGFRYKKIFELFEQIQNKVCLLYTSPSPRDRQKSRMPSSA